MECCSEITCGMVLGTEFHTSTLTSPWGPLGRGFHRVYVLSTRPLPSCTVRLGMVQGRFWRFNVERRGRTVGTKWVHTVPSSAHSAASLSRELHFHRHSRNSELTNRIFYNPACIGLWGGRCNHDTRPLREEPVDTSVSDKPSVGGVLSVRVQQ